MDVVALILAIIAIILFAVGRGGRYGWADVPMGLAFLTAALICQFVHLTGHLVVVN